MDEITKFSTTRYAPSTNTGLNTTAARISEHFHSCFFVRNLVSFDMSVCWNNNSASLRRSYCRSCFNCGSYNWHLNFPVTTPNIVTAWNTNRSKLIEFEILRRTSGMSICWGTATMDKITKLSTACCHTVTSISASICFRIMAITSLITTAARISEHFDPCFFVRNLVPFDMSVCRNNYGASLRRGHRNCGGYNWHLNFPVTTPNIITASKQRNVPNWRQKFKFLYFGILY